MITTSDVIGMGAGNDLAYTYDSGSNTISVTNTYSLEDFISSSYVSYGVDKPTLKPDKIIFNPPATIVFWNDGTKTVVKTNGDYFTAEGGLFAALARKMWGRAQTKKFMKQAKHVITTDNVDRWMHYGK